MFSAIRSESVNSEAIGKLHNITYLISPDKLCVHEQLVTIYGETEERPDLQASIVANGIIKPLVTSRRTGANVVISGKCRLQIARNLGLETVPVEFRDYSSWEQEVQDILLENQERKVKTTFQKIGEAITREGLEANAAKKRKGRRKHSCPQELGQARDKAATAVGMSGRSYEDGKKVWHFISDLR
ncbi:MAG: ParB N-terminal domain-containing protein [Scytonema sp. RU_4_4]|nr:ParB N-terminal domain-containing protein [Scytonema sp. RU_4_4]